MAYEDRDGHEFCDGEIEESPIKRMVREGMRETRETGDELVRITEQMEHERNLRAL